MREKPKHTFCKQPRNDNASVNPISLLPLSYPGEISPTLPTIQLSFLMAKNIRNSAIRMKYDYRKYATRPRAFIILWRIFTFFDNFVFIFKLSVKLFFFSLSHDYPILKSEYLKTLISRWNFPKIESNVCGWVARIILARKALSHFSLRCTVNAILIIPWHPIHSNE